MDKRELAAERLFGEALELPPADRDAFLERACAGEPALRRRIEDLLDENDRLSGFLSAPVYKNAPKTVASAAELAVRPGTRLLDRYHIESTLGAGGMGVVYKARDEKLDREVAIKMLQPGVWSGSDARARFQREARALARLNHAHIAAIHDVIEEGGVDFIVMELVAGESLAARLRRGPLPVKEATSLVLQVAQALEEAHEQAVIHRDLKPANVMITPRGEVKVLDFGLARLMGQIDATQTAPDSGVMGTPFYMSPEQAIGQRADARSDLWALGVTYYEALAGTAPFHGANTLEILRAVTDLPAPPLRDLRPDAPELAEQITNRALEKDPDLRYQHARDLATDLRRVLRDLEPTRGATGTLPRRVQKDSRSKWKLTAGLALALVIIAGLAFWLWPPVRAPRVLAMTQITHDETTKVADGFNFGQHLMTDGSRIFYEVEDEPGSLLREASVEGGEADLVPMPLKDHAAMAIRLPSELLSLGDPLAATNDAGAVWHMTLPGGQPQRIGNFQANDASWSPDGNSVYWALNGKMSVTRLDGTETKPIVTMQGYAGNIAFSPDGTRMRFSVTPHGASTSTIWEASPEGSHPRPLFSQRDRMGNQCCGMWTPDGRYYVFQADRGGTPNVWAVREKQHWWERIDPRPVQLTVGPMSAQLPLPSLDGSRIFLVGTVPRSELEMYDTRKKQFSMILPRLSAEHVAYTRDGSRMAYVAEPNGTLWVSRKDQSDRHQLSFAPMVAALPSWSPDGRQIALMGREPGKSWRIYLVSSEPGTFPTPVTAGDVSEGDQTWSPDGKSIAFAGVSGNVDSATHPVQIMDLTTHRIASLPGSAGMVGTRWSPDGKNLIAVVAHSGVGPLMLYSFATKQWTRLLKTPIAYPAWSHDGKCVYYIDSTEGNSIHRVCLSDRKPKLIGDLQQAGQLTNGRFGPWFGLAPDDSILALRDSGIEEIYSLQMDWR